MDQQLGESKFCYVFHVGLNVLNNGSMKLKIVMIAIRDKGYNDMEKENTMMDPYIPMTLNSN